MNQEQAHLQPEGEEGKALPTKENEAGDQQEQKMAQNPNPRANENIAHTEITTEETTTTVGSEITDGEGG